MVQINKKSFLLQFLNSIKLHLHATIPLQYEARLHLFTDHSFIESPIQQLNMSSERLFSSEKSEYQKIVKKHDNEYDIADIIQSDLFDTYDKNNLIRIRNMQNDELFPFNADAFIRWFEQSPTHPLTRENLQYLTDRVRFKKECRQKLSYRPFSDITDDFSRSLVVRLFGLLEKLYTNHEVLSEEESLQLMECEAYTDISTWQDCGLLFTTLDFSQTVEKLSSQPNGSWIIRKSSQHQNIMKNAEIVVLATKCLGQIYQYRLLYVYGIGWFVGDSSMPLTSLRELQAAGYVYPKHLTWSHVVEHFAQTQSLDVTKLIRPF